ncbi:MAG: GNAT family N-acetyltransferase [Dehalococcoidia bacterium]
MPDEIRVREAVADDLGSAEALLRSEIEYDARWHTDLDDLGSSYLGREDQTLFVAEVEGQAGVIGTAAVRHRMPTVVEVARRFDPQVSAELGRVVVAPSWRRRGVAVRLSEAARVWAFSHGYQTLHLHTEAVNAPALALWRSIANEIPRPERPEHESIYFEIPIALPVRPREPARPGGYVVRLAKRRDLPAARALMLRVLDEDYGYGYQPEIHADMDDLEGYYLRHPGQAFAVAVDDESGEIIAVGCVQAGGRFPPPRPDALVARFPREATGEIARVFAAREHRRRGAARDIVERLRRWAVDDARYEHLVLHTNTARDGAEAFWRSMAVELYDARPTTFNTVHFKLPLDQPVAGSHHERIVE